uniref:UAS domain-containing protein n=1 Tax=Quercus lobata TaxID=97700 RepID=A0A7N2LP15_QUELO
MKRSGVWESDQGSLSTTENHQDSLASLYRPPYHLMFHGSFEKLHVKNAAASYDKWLLMNLQSTKEFTSHMVYDDTTEGRKVCTYYKLDSFPVVLVIDPITGQKMRSWCGMVQTDQLLEDLLSFMDGGPKDRHIILSDKRQRESSLTPHQSCKDETNEEDGEMIHALAASMEGMKDLRGRTAKDKDITVTEEEKTCTTKKLAYPPLPEEPKGDRNLLCRVRFHLPDGRKVQRNFF